MATMVVAIQDVRSIKVTHHGPSQGYAPQTAEPTRLHFRQRHSFNIIQGLYIICQPRHGKMPVRLHIGPVLMFPRFGMLPGGSTCSVQC